MGKSAITKLNMARIGPKMRRGIMERTVDKKEEDVVIKKDKINEIIDKRSVRNNWDMIDTIDTIVV